MAIIPVEIVSDPICPWCFIGLRTLQRAIALHRKTYPGGSSDIFEISWKPYFIDPVEPVGSILIHDRMARRMTKPQIDAAQTRLRRVGRALGIEFRFGGYIGSSRPAHRVLHLAGKEGSQIQCRVAEMLFKYQFERERDVSEVDVVVAAAVEGGMDEGAVREFLTGSQGVGEVEREEKEYREKLKATGVQGVPQFYIGGLHSFEGAGDVGEFLEGFVAARAARVEIEGL
ncbi:thioredoxin-like protein [Aspergillus karnatakaensis]|uniref:thioredoxin-like protein n=1 Tax=Aspergillus karnatakaensis TaxID=1810916 RepID=UPI003CCE3F96